jgi:magnesium chelatase family protein
LEPLVQLATADLEPGESTASVRARVQAARASALARWADRGWRTNAEVPGSALRGEFRLPRAAVAPLDAALRRGELTARGADRALRTAWTLADLAGSDRPDQELVCRAIEFKERRAA